MRWYRREKLKSIMMVHRSMKRVDETKEEYQYCICGIEEDKRIEPTDNEKDCADEARKREL